MTDSPPQIPLRGDASVIANLEDAFDDDCIADLEGHAMSHGVTPPDNRPGWKITPLFGQPNEYLGLHWYNGGDDSRAWIDQ